LTTTSPFRTLPAADSITLGVAQTDAEQVGGTESFQPQH
jgi:hypothetical protein